MPSRNKPQSQEIVVPITNDNPFFQDDRERIVVRTNAGMPRIQVHFFAGLPRDVTDEWAGGGVKRIARTRVSMKVNGGGIAFVGVSHGRRIPFSETIVWRPASEGKNGIRKPLEYKAASILSNHEEQLEAAFSALSSNERAIAESLVNRAKSELVKSEVPYGVFREDRIGIHEAEGRAPSIRRELIRVARDVKQGRVGLPRI